MTMTYSVNRYGPAGVYVDPETEHFDTYQDALEAIANHIGRHPAELDELRWSGDADDGILEAYQEMPADLMEERGLSSCGGWAILKHG